MTTGEGVMAPPSSTKAPKPYMSNRAFFRSRTTGTLIPRAEVDQLVNELTPHNTALREMVVEGQRLSVKLQWQGILTFTAGLIVLMAGMALTSYASAAAGPWMIPLGFGLSVALALGTTLVLDKYARETAAARDRQDDLIFRTVCAERKGAFDTEWDWANSPRWTTGQDAPPTERPTAAAVRSEMTSPVQEGTEPLTPNDDLADPAVAHPSSFIAQASDPTTTNKP